MLFKVLIDRKTPKGEYGIECKIIHVVQEFDLETRISNILSKMITDGYEYARLVDCFNLNMPDFFQKQQP